MDENCTKNYKKNGAGCKKIFRMCKPKVADKQFDR